MSRLDDELKIAFQRQEPPADFAARVLARLGEAPAPQPNLWQRLAGLFALPAWRYAAVGAAALLLIVIGIVALRARQTAGVQPDAPQMTASERQGGDGAKPAPVEKGGANDLPVNVVASAPSSKASKAPARHHAPAVARQPQPSAEAEAAKEKVLFALQITSETLKDAQRAISEDGDDRHTNPKPEPVMNR